MKRNLLMTLLFLLTILQLGCTGTSKVPATVEASSLSFMEPVREYMKHKNLKMYVNSGAHFDLQLPKDFGFEKDGVRYGELLQLRNEQSKQHGFDFTSYMGKKVTLYTAHIQTETPELSYGIVLLVADNKVIGHWKDFGKNDPKQDKTDFGVLLGLR